LVGCAPETKKRVGFILPQPDFVFLGGAPRPASCYCQSAHYTPPNS
jgi:hypothetical protein